jgi:hypothetical protein
MDLWLFKLLKKVIILTQTLKRKSEVSICFINLIHLNFNLFIGNDRIKVATECILTANGSAHKYTNNKVAEVIKAGEANDVDVIVRPGQLGNFRRIVSKSVKELLHTEVSNYYQFYEK